MTADALQTWIGSGLALVGALFMVVGAIGLLRMPDVFTRMHATSVIDTVGAGFVFVGLTILSGFSLVSVKLIILIFVFGLMGPVATHAVARAALYAGVKPVDRSGKDLEVSPSKP